MDQPLKAYSPQVFSEGVYDSGRTKMHQAPSADASFCGHLRCFAKEGSGSWKLEVGEMEGGLDYWGFKLVKNLVELEVKSGFSWNSDQIIWSFKHLSKQTAIKQLSTFETRMREFGVIWILPNKATVFEGLTFSQTIILSPEFSKISVMICSGWDSGGYKW